MKPKIRLEHTSVFTRNLKSTQRIILNQGGTRSSKTYSIAQLFIYKALTEQNKVFSIVRASMPSLRGSAMKDFFSILKAMEMYDENAHSIITLSFWSFT